MPTDQDDRAAVAVLETPLLVPLEDEGHPAHVTGERVKIRARYKELRRQRPEKAMWTCLEIARAEWLRAWVEGRQGE